MTKEKYKTNKNSNKKRHSCSRAITINLQSVGIATNNHYRQIYDKVSAKRSANAVLKIMFDCLRF